MSLPDEVVNNLVGGPASRIGKQRVIIAAPINQYESDLERLTSQGWTVLESFETEIEDPTFEPCGACKACVEDAAEVEAAGVVSVARVPAEPPPTPEGTGTEKDDDDGR